MKMLNKNLFFLPIHQNKNHSDKYVHGIKEKVHRSAKIRKQLSINKIYKNKTIIPNEKRFNIFSHR